MLTKTSVVIRRMVSGWLFRDTEGKCFLITDLDDLVEKIKEMPPIEQATYDFNTFEQRLNDLDA